MRFKTKILIANTIITLIATSAIYYVARNTISYTREQLKIITMAAAIIVPIAITIQFILSIKPFSIIQEFEDRFRDNKLNESFVKFAFKTALYFPLLFMTLSAVQWYTASVIFFIIGYVFAHASLSISARMVFAIVNGATIANIFQYFVYHRISRPLLRKIQTQLRNTNLAIKIRMGVMAKIFLSFALLSLLFLIFISDISSKLVENILKEENTASAKIELSVYEPGIDSLLAEQLSPDVTAYKISRLKLGTSGYALIMDNKFNDVLNISDIHSASLPLDKLSNRDVYNDYADNDTLIKIPYKDGLFLVGVLPWSDYEPVLNSFNESLSWLFLIIGVLLTFFSLLTAVDTYLPIRALAVTVEKLASGDFSATTGLYVEDESGIMANSLRKMIRDIQETLKNIKSSSSAILETSDHLLNFLDTSKESISMHGSEVKAGINSVMSVQDTINQLTEHMDGLMNYINDTIVNGNDLTESIKNTKNAVDAVKKNNDEYMKLNSDFLTITAGINKYIADAVSTAEGDRNNHLRYIEDESSKFIAENQSLIEQMKNDYSGLLQRLSLTLGNYKKVEDNVNKFTSIAPVLNVNVNKIVSDINAIDAVIDDTNLLAMNSSVISAQAGETGRGFDVISEEITKLADVTQNKIYEFKGLTELLVKEKDTLITSINESRKFVSVLTEKSGSFENEVKKIPASISSIDNGYDRLYDAMKNIFSEIHSLINHNTASSDALQIVKMKTPNIENDIKNISKISSEYGDTFDYLYKNWSDLTNSMIPLLADLIKIQDSTSTVNGYMGTIKDKTTEIKGILDSMMIIAGDIEDKIKQTGAEAYGKESDIRNAVLKRDDKDIKQADIRKQLKEIQDAIKEETRIYRML